MSVKNTFTSDQPQQGESHKCLTTVDVLSSLLLFKLKKLQTLAYQTQQFNSLQGRTALSKLKTIQRDVNK